MKNAFEIRLEVLKMAKEMAEQHYLETSNSYWTTINEMAKMWNKSAEELFEQTKSMQPKMYTPQEIMEKAQELYNFVEKKNQ